MPISRKTFESAFMTDNPQLLDWFVKHPNTAYNINELQKKFGLKVSGDLTWLAMNHHIESKLVGGVWYFQLLKKLKKP